ncbi:hypothetical protein RO3G_11523 [Rhizopus delemar RA 99-880]|uniref:CCHC-type domain-containing protein n=1 Tax=Rhizopus delemar (strain RA 99-880 / ATCC MYA-4621 / FGSC 9543 / NRRL 43880) TaxID=246409 RepID=I1CED2_RHIO9|nr:hypothetical protein RO3G_11523 [Rhizopus delemar RA 99-880]|eukprot:EIE86812.1 hypothetical protein RO3G_11523 [Rhizopus delemar RA 99-880]
MVLSPTNAKPPEEGDNIPNNAQQPESLPVVSRRSTKVLYSKIHQRPAKTRESLIHTKPMMTSSVQSSSPYLSISKQNSPVIIDTVYWGVSQTPGSLFFDITSRKESDRTIYKLAFGQFHDYVGLVVHKSGYNRYLEINFDNDHFRSKACENGFHFDNGQIIIRPVVACRPGSTIRRLTLQRLPWLRPQQLLEGLKHTLSSYGYVRDVGIVTDSDTGAFLGSGYAVLDCTSDSSQPDPFLDLAHIMPWVDPHNPETDDCSVYIHAYWKEMPTYCKYCHELGHSASECQQAPSNKRVCYYCYKPGHIRVQCPDKISPAKRLRGSHKSKTTMPSPKNTMVDAVKTVELLDNQNGSTIRSTIQDQPQESRVDSPTTAPIPNEDTVEDILSVPSKTREHIQYADDVSMSDISEQSNNEGSIQSQWATTSEPFSSPETDTGSSNIDPPVVSTSETKKTTKDSSTTGPRRSTRATRPPDRLDL